MTWWTSIVFYLWRNSLRRWVEQPLGILSKLAISALIGALSAVMMLGAGFLGKELTRQLSSRDAMSVHVSEIVGPKRVSRVIGAGENEEQGWMRMASESMVVYQAPTAIRMNGNRVIPIMAMRDPEGYGYPDTLILLSEKRHEGSREVVNLDDVRAEVLVMPPRGDLLKQFLGGGEAVIGSVDRLAPLLQRGFTRQVRMQAKSVESIEHMDQVVEAMKVVEGRRVRMQSVLPLLQQLREIRAIQQYIMIAVTIGAALTLGLISGALAWMEFREERYLLSLIRSFGVGRRMLFSHAMIENCLVSVAGVSLGLGLLGLAAITLDGGLLNFPWLNLESLLSIRVMGVLLVGALLGGLLSSVPVAIGLRKPLGLTLK